MKSFREYKEPKTVVEKAVPQRTKVIQKIAEEVRNVAVDLPTPAPQTDYVSSIAAAISRPNFTSLTSELINKLPVAEMYNPPEPELPTLVPKVNSVEEIARSISRPTGGLFALLEQETPAISSKKQIIETNDPIKNLARSMSRGSGRDITSLFESNVADAQPATTFAPTKAGIVQQVKNALSEPKFSKNETPVPNLQKAELDGIRTSISNLMSRVNTLSIGGGGTGIVRIGMADDFDPLSYGEGRYLKWSRGAFRLDEINPFEIIHNTTEVTSNTYTIVDSDYYIGVNYNGVCNVTLPTDPASGRTVVIKDESGNAQLNPINILGTIDNDAGGATIKINNGAVQLLYRNGWRII